MSVLRRLVQVAHRHPKTRKHLVPVIRRHLASWDPGEVTEDGFDTGKVVPREHDDIGIGSQVPPAHDHRGRPLEAMALRNPVNRSLHRAEMAIEAELPKVAAAVERHLQRFRPGVHNVSKLSSMTLTLDPAQRMWVARGHQSGGSDPYQVTGNYYGELSGRYSWVPLPKTARSKTAGEVRFIKDRSGDETQWGWNNAPPTEREITSDYEFKPKNLKPLAEVLRSTTAALGHMMSAYTKFSKIKSATVSPDGSLGGKGYIAKIPEMRRSYMNGVEAMSALVDTLYDELDAPHWNPALEEQGPREREEVQDILSDVEDIREDPEEWAEEEEAEMDAEHGKTARRRPPQTKRRPNPRGRK
jgi:hypothetical protein